MFFILFVTFAKKILASPQHYLSVLPLLCAYFMHINAKFQCILMQNLKSDNEWLERLASKVSQYILNNESFQQIVCDSLSLQFQDDIDELKNEISDLKKNNNHLEVLLEEQEQYSRRNCLLIHGIPVGSNEDTDQIALVRKFIWSYYCKICQVQCQKAYL